MKKRKVDAMGIRVNAWEVFSRAVNEGVNYGWNRAHKHTDKPSEELIMDTIESAVTNAVCEYFEFLPTEDK